MNNIAYVDVDICTKKLKHITFETSIQETKTWAILEIMRRGCHLDYPSIDDALIIFKTYTCNILGNKNGGTAENNEKRQTILPSERT